LDLFEEIHPIEIRYISLQYKFMLKSLSKRPSFAIYYARKANESQLIAGFVFSQLRKNEFFERCSCRNICSTRGVLVHFQGWLKGEQTGVGVERQRLCSPF
jgi:hypothetical protein